LNEGLGVYWSPHLEVASIVPKVDVKELEVKQATGLNVPSLSMSAKRI
jgi:hypothetical protein